MLAAGDTAETILEGYPWLEPEDIQACLIGAELQSGAIITAHGQRLRIRPPDQ